MKTVKEIKEQLKTVIEMKSPEDCVLKGERSGFINALEWVLGIPDEECWEPDDDLESD
jgi:hypothetical protein